MSGARRLARDAVGVGLRPEHYAAIRQQPPAVDFLEIIAENFLGPSELPRTHLDAVAARYPVVAHNISLNLLGTDPLDADYLRRLRWLVRRHGMPCVTDHLAWTRSDGQRHHDLLPAPCSAELVPWAAARIRAVRDAVGAPFGVENPSTYLRFTRDDLPEWEFVRRVVEAADCGLLLDVNNVFVSAVNHGFDPRDYLAAVPWERVLYVHVAGHTVRPDGLRHDTHDGAVAPEVWALYAHAWALGGPFPTLLEWDDRIPALDVVVAEAQTARAVRR